MKNMNIKNMEQHISQEETRRIIISDMVKKRGTIVPIIGDDTIVYREKNSSEEIPCDTRDRYLSRVGD